MKFRKVLLPLMALPVIIGLTGCESILPEFDFEMGKQ